MAYNALACYPTPFANRQRLRNLIIICETDHLGRPARRYRLTGGVHRQTGAGLPIHRAGQATPIFGGRR